MADKYGSYIQKLMTVVIDSEQEEFVQKLAWAELRRLGDAVEEFLDKHDQSVDPQEQEKTEKKLLQEKQNGKD